MRAPYVRQDGMFLNRLLPAILFTLIFSFTSAIIPLSPSWADIYKYEDKDGVVHFTNVPITATYRKVALPTYSTPVTPIKPPCSLMKPGAKGSTSYERRIQSTCLAYGLDHKLVKAVIQAESGFNPAALSPKGAIGLMQLMPETSKLMGVEDPFDPNQNIEGGVRYLRNMLDRFQNNLVLALAAYNAGPKAVERYNGIPPYDETLVYIQRVLRYYLANLK